MKHKNKDFKNIINNFFDKKSPDEAKNFFLDSIAKFCDRCGSPFGAENIDVVKRTPGQILLHIKCSECGSSHLASFIQQLGISSRTPFRTDLTLNELKHFSSQDALDSNTVLDVYEFVNSQKDLAVSEFGRLLSKALRSRSKDRSDPNEELL